MSRAGQYLLAEYNKRKERNPRYSMRAFSRDVGLYPGRISQYFSGKRPISKTMVQHLSGKLQLDKDMTEYFLYLADIDKKTKRTVQPRVLQDDELALIAEWYHFTVLSLIATEDFRYDYKWMSTRTGLPEDLVRISVERLIRLNLVSEKNRSLTLNTPHLSTTHDIPSSVLRLSHKDSLQHVMNRMDQVPVEMRDVTSITLPVNEKKIPAAKEMIKTFRRRLAKVLGEGKKTQVYTVNVALFPLTKVGEPHA